MNRHTFSTLAWASLTTFVVGCGGTDRPATIGATRPVRFVPQDTTVPRGDQLPIDALPEPAEKAKSAENLPPALPTAVPSAGQVQASNRLRKEWNQAYSDKLHDVGRELARLKPLDPQIVTTFAKKLEQLQNPPAASPLDGILNDQSRVLTEADRLAFESEADKLFGTVIDEAVAAIRAKRTGAPAEPPPAGPSGDEGAGSQEPARVIEFAGALDIFAPQNSAQLAKLKKSQAGKFFPNGKARMADGFDKLSTSEQIEVIARNSSDYVRKAMQFLAKRDKLAQEALDRALSGQGFAAPAYQARFRDMASEIVAGSGNVTTTLPTIEGIVDEDQRRSLKVELDAANAKFNALADKAIARETKAQRQNRLLELAKQKVVEANPLLLETVADLPEVAVAQLGQYAEEAARPLVTDTSEPTETDPEVSEIDQFEDRVKQGVKEVYLRYGGALRFLDLLGLKGVFARMIIESVAEMVGRRLNAKETVKAQAWAASLADELHDPNAQGRQPSPIVQRPVTFPTWQVPAGPMMPIMPYGHLGHGHKFGHHRPMLFMVPGSAGYVILPR
jgi:hypothetical protein